MPHTFDPLSHPILFQGPRRLTTTSFWTEHIPFGMLLVELLRPNLLVELGTHYGDSYCAFCQTVQALSLPTKCFAVDTWRGDQHVGQYGPEVLADLRAHHDELYNGISHLMQSTFDEAVAHFEEGSIDLLHIDGTHTYESVKHDFETWLPKMSPIGVVLLHDTNIRQPNFGVWRFWSEVKQQYPHMEFLHGCGLGVLATGKRIPDAVAKWLDECQEPGYLNQVRDFFFQIGRKLTLLNQLRSELERATHQFAEKEQAAIGLQERLGRTTPERDQAERKIAALELALEEERANGQRARVEFSCAMAAQAETIRELNWQVNHVRERVPAAAKLIDYGRAIVSTRQCVRAHVPDGATVAVLSKGDDHLLDFTARGWHFPRAENGDYTGYYPADDAEAIIHLEAVRGAGADFLLIPTPAFWWLDHYPAFRRHLERRYRLAQHDENVVLFDLRRIDPSTPDGDGGQPTQSGQALVIIPGSVNYFYDRVGHRLADTLVRLGYTVKVSDLKGAPAEEADWCFFINPYEVAVGYGDEAAAARRMAAIRSRCGAAVGVLLECASTPWFARSLEVCERAGLRRLLDLGFRGQYGDLPQNLRAGYHFAFNGLNAGEAATLKDSRGAGTDRPIPWVFVGHASPTRLGLVERLLRDVDPGGFVYVPRLGPVAERGPHINGAQLGAILKRARCQVWCSHHAHFYLESERFRDSLLAGCLPIKVVPSLPGPHDLLPFRYLLVEEEGLTTAWDDLVSGKTWDRFVADFAALPTLEESLGVVLGVMSQEPRQTAEVLCGN